MERDIVTSIPFGNHYISTHTLTWSVTAVVYAVQKDYKNFNSHAHVERDNIPRYVDTFEKDFNSHAHVERD